MGKPFIKLLHTINSGYFYDVNRNELVEVSDEGYQYLQNVLEDRAVMEDAPEDVKRLKKAGYLSDHHVKEIKHPMTDYIRDLLAQNIGTITLQLTQDCNFRCEYCVYSDTESNIGQRQHSRKKMSLDTAKSAVCFLRDHAIGVKKLNIGFYGGEPLLQFQLIKDIILFAEEELFGKEVAYSITTNGSLLKGEVLDFLKEHQVSVNLSFDGPKPIQDNNRRLARSDASTYDLVYRNVRKAYEKYPEYVKTFFVHMVIVPTYEFDEIEAFFDTPILNQMMFTGSLVDDHYSSNKHPMAKTFHAKTQYQNFLAYLYVLERLDREKISPLVRESISHNLQKTEGILGGRGIPVSVPRRDSVFPEKPDRSVMWTETCIPANGSVNLLPV